MTVPEQAVAFISKWRVREPEMAYAEVFCPRSLRARFALWGALLHELREATFELSDTRLIEAKSAWWADELLRSAQGAPRHPLTLALASPLLPWDALARGLHAVAQTDAQRPSDREVALAAIAPLAQGIAMFEAALFDVPMTDDAIAAVVVHLLGERLRHGLAAADGGRVPLSLFARHGITSSMLTQAQGVPVVADWAAELATMLPADVGGIALYRSTRAAFDTWFLHELAANRPRRPIPRLRALRLAWRTARAGRRTV